MEKVEDFENWEENKKWWALKNSDKNKIKEKWRGLGLLESFDEDQEDDLSLSLETLTMLVLSRASVDQSKIEGLIETLIFPITVRVFRKLPHLMCHDYVMLIYNIACKRIPEVYKEVGEISGEGIDWEAEICAIVADEIIAQFTKNQTGQN